MQRRYSEANSELSEASASDSSELFRVSARHALAAAQIEMLD